MNFLEKLDMMMGELQINKMKLSQLSGVPYTTIDGFYKKGYENAKISTIRKIASALNVSLDYLIEDTDMGEIPLTLGEERLRLLKAFDELNPEGREKVFAYISDLSATGLYKKYGQSGLVSEEA